jgi:pimeloyl-ACP methyl ester carboxylesterase
MPHLDRDGVRIYYEIHGDGPAVLLSHGFAGTTRMWRPNLEALSARCRVVAWDMRGHGQSDSPDDPAAYSEAATAADMGALLDVAGAECAVVGGLSFGGYMSLAFNLLHPDRVAALMLFDTGPGYRSDEQRAQWNAVVESMAERLSERGLEGLWGGAEVEKDAHGSAGGLIHAARGMIVQREAHVFDSLPRISVPTLVLVGEQDEQFRGAADYMARKVPGARLVVLDEAGHAANIHQPEAFNGAVLGFLEELAWVR